MGNLFKDEPVPYPKTDEEKKQLLATWKKKQKAKRIERMHLLHGVRADKRCGDCIHCKGKQHARIYWKCELYGLTNGPATDWVQRWLACGQFKPKGEHNDTRKPI